MESEINSLPIREVLLLVLIGGLIQLGMYLISTYILPVLKKKRPPVGLFWERSQIVLWGIFALFSFSLLFRENMYLTLAATGLILALSWSFWVNFFAGLTIKFTNQFRPGNHVSTDLAEGKIQAIKMSFTEVINSKGELIVVPNRLLKNAVLKHINQKNKLKTSIFICSGEHNHNKLYNHAINCPFISGNQKITISKNQNNTYEIKAMLLDDSFLEEAVAYFKDLK
jgi:hypothetical protein